MKNLAALTKPGGMYPGFISINKQDDGSVTIDVREIAKEYEGVKVCGHQCKPGGHGCNGYCEGKSDKPEPHHHVKEGAQVRITLTEEEWQSILRKLEELNK